MEQMGNQLTLAALSAKVKLDIPGRGIVAVRDTTGARAAVNWDMRVTSARRANAHAARRAHACRAHARRAHARTRARGDRARCECTRPHGERARTAHTRARGTSVTCNQKLTFASRLPANALRDISDRASKTSRAEKCEAQSQRLVVQPTEMSLLIVDNWQRSRQRSPYEPIVICFGACATDPSRSSTSSRSDSLDSREPRGMLASELLRRLIAGGFSTDTSGAGIEDPPVMSAKARRR